MDTTSNQALRRRAEIVRLVRRHPVRSQEELQALLRRRGLHAAQPTLSRDLKDLGLARTPVGYVVPPEASPFVRLERRAAALDRVLVHSALDVRSAGTIVVIHTPPAGAPVVARTIDEAALPDVVGTVAGDDTVFVATADPPAARRVERRLRAPLHPSPRRA